jgi:pimeloyl-ACP methyl ester carboxylesterase
VPAPKVGHFRSERAREHYLGVYDAAMADLPPAREQIDVSTSFGNVRVYRFDGPSQGTPVVLLPGRNASTPMYGDNLPPLLERRTVYCVDLLGEAGMSVQRQTITGPDDQAQWFDEALAGLGLDRVHLLGVSMGGWTAANAAIRCPGRAASVVLLDPAMTFAPIPAKTIVASMAMYLPGVPDAVLRRVLRWIAGGAELDDAPLVAALIAAGSTDFKLRTPMPKLFTDDQLRTLDIPVLALIAGRSVIHNAGRAAARARNLLPRGQVEVWPDASHAVNGEYPEKIAETAEAFWRRA